VEEAVTSRYAHEPEVEEGTFGVEVAREYELFSGEAFWRCRVCGVLYDEGPRSVCASKIVELGR